MKTFLYRLGVYLYLSLIYRNWSRLYRALAEWKYRDVPLTLYSTWDSLVENIRKLQWTADPWHQLFDAISCPGRVEHVLAHEPVKKVGDCDEFAIYLTNALEKSIGRCLMPALNQLYPLRARFLTVTWMKSNGELGGHNVCLIDWFTFEDQSSADDADGAGCGYSYMDYSYPSPVQGSVREIVQQVLDRYAGPASTCLGWGLHDKDLNLLEAHWS